MLLPEKFGTYYIFPKRIVGFEITKNYIFATVVYLHGHTVIVEQCLEIAVEQDNGQETTTRTANAIKKALTAIGKYSAVHVGIASSQAIFKTMKLPFEDHEKIKRVVDFEVEPLLPFSITDAVVDFIITRQNKEEKSSEICVAAVQKQYIKQTLDIFQEVGVKPEVITIDLFELYGLYKEIPYYNNLTGGIILMDIGLYMTKIAYVLDGQLKFIRTLAFGTTHLAKSIASHLSIASRDAMDDLLRHGFSKDETPAYIEAVNAAAESFTTKIKFTMQSFTAQTNPEEQFSHLFLFGVGATIKGFDKWLEQSLHIPCAIFNSDKIATDTHITLKKMAHIPVENSISASIAIPNSTTENFNLLQKEFSPFDNQLLLKQLIVGGVLLLILFCSLLMHSYLQVRTLKNAMEKSQKEASTVLAEWFPNIEVERIDAMIEEAQSETKKEEKLWFAFSRCPRNSFLNLLLMLTKLDREALGLIFDKIILDQDKGTMIIKAQVKEDKDYNALARFENELRQSKMFSFVPDQDNPSFTTELKFATGPEEES